LNKHPNLTSLSINSYSNKFDVALTTLLTAASQLPNLQKFGFASCKNMRINNILNIAPSFLYVRYLTLDFSDIDDNDLDSMSEMLPKLEFLSMKCCYKVTEEGFENLCGQLTSVVAVNFKYVKAFTSSAL
jgi:hypothetical protein